MSRDSEDEILTDVLENAAEVVEDLSKELAELYQYRDLFFENHPLELANEKNKFVDQKKDVILEKFENIDDSQIPLSLRAQFLYLKGRCYNISPTYDARATQSLSKAVKLNPHLVDAWNELGECYWKNMNVKDAKASFEGALKHERNRLSLRCLSIILRQESGANKRGEATATIFKSVELAKEAVALDPKDGVSWTILGNAYLCQFFMVAQDTVTLKACLSAYKQAWADPIAKGQPDLYYNRGIALKYEECYDEALESFDYACRLDPPWEPPKLELNMLRQYVHGTNDLVRTKGKIKTKKLLQMVQSIDKKMIAPYGPDTKHTVGTRKNVTFEQVRLDALQEGDNEGKVLLGRVVGSIHSESAVPFTFAIVDESMQCVCVTVYNWADGRGAIIGDCVAVPEPRVKTHKLESPLATYNFKSIRVNNPMWLLVNGKRVGREQYASTRVTSTYQIH
ncbi:tetratricopeptide repeat protein 5-like isoform X2 [Hyposmocoma kahamanoa]|uniref:tetratricopeptide repeat protein 5-like isoform X2 n=1 Tax=Hyposmocoma kahamanoa TaxID=1477025 RepID=UPI000E6D851C|nr:tetratricopeptide repeat protein 5-like isoform X2 [Hyposmocoma kahamanoa]